MSQLSDTMLKSLNKQVQREFMSAYIYYGLVAYFEELNFSGIAAHFKAAAVDELEHGQKFAGYIIDCGGVLELFPLDKPPTKYKTPVDAFKAALQREKEITDDIHKLYKQALKENDYATQVVLHDMIREQIEEIKDATGLLEKAEKCAGNNAAMIMLDRELARIAAMGGGH